MSGNVTDISQRRGRRGRSGPPWLPPEPPVINGRVPPHDLIAEAAVIAAILNSRDALDRVLEILRPEHFYSEPNRAIYETAIALLEAKSPVDMLTVTSWLRDRERLAAAGGPSYISDICDRTPSVHNAAAHAQIVIDKARVRRMIATTQRITAEGYGDVGPVDEWLDAGEQAVFDLVHVPSKSQVQPLGAVLKVAFQRITAAAERGERITGMPTGYDKLDAKTSGLFEGDLTVVAGRPGMGKTSFVLNVGVNVASPRTVTEQHPEERRLVERHINGQGVVIFSLEMPREQLAIRMLCSEARVDLGRMRQGFLLPNDWQRLTESAAYLGQLPLWIDDTPAIGLLEIRAKVRRIQAEYNRPATAETPERKLGLVVVDYLQLMSGNGDSREQEISAISRGLKALAKELSVPVIALSQLNRAVETRSTKDKRPQLSDLRESGAIEQDADNIIFIYRDEYYNAENSQTKGLAELIISKQRNGPTGKVMTRFTASCTRFDNLAAGDYPEHMEDE